MIHDKQFYLFTLTNYGYSILILLYLHILKGGIYEKEIINVLLMLMLAFSFTACSSDDDDSSSKKFERDKDDEDDDDEDEDEDDKKEDDKKPSFNFGDGELSENLFDFQFSIDGEVYALPMWYEEFEDLGGTTKEILI